MRGAGGSGPGAGQASGDGVHGHDGQGKPKLLEREATVSSIQRNARKRVVGWGGEEIWHQSNLRDGLLQSTPAPPCLPAKPVPVPEEGKVSSALSAAAHPVPRSGNLPGTASPPAAPPFPHRSQPFSNKKETPAAAALAAGASWPPRRTGRARSLARLSLASDAKATPVGSDCCSLLAPNSE